MEKPNTQTSSGAPYFRHEMYPCFLHLASGEQGRADSSSFSSLHHLSWPQGPSLSLTLPGDSHHGTFPEDCWPCSGPTLLYRPTDRPVLLVLRCSMCSSKDSPAGNSSRKGGTNKAVFVGVRSSNRCVLWPTYSSSG